MLPTMKKIDCIPTKPYWKSSPKGKCWSYCKQSKKFIWLQWHENIIMNIPSFLTEPKIVNRLLKPAVADGELF